MAGQGREPKIPVLERPPWAQRIIAARKIAGLSQAELADKTGFGQRSIASYEVGDSQPNFAQISRIAECLGVPPESIAFGEPPDDSTFVGLTIQRYQKDDGFTEAFFETGAMISEIGLNMDLYSAALLAQRLLKKAKTSAEHGTLRDRIRWTVAAERAQLQSDIDRVVKYRASA